MNSKELAFCSPTHGKVQMSETFDLIKKFIETDATKEYEIVIGADSQNFINYTKFVLVIAVHRKGKGGIFFYYCEHLDYFKNLQKKIHHEVQMSIEVAFMVLKEIEGWNYENLSFNHIDIDIGENGKTKTMIKEVVGWVNGVLGVHNVHARIKPMAPIASCVADKISK